ncbi:peptidase M16 domain protein [Clostridium sp. CAG:571]|nr:peptidase M16 domain protein [Clostridium sp. CAG:571]HJJ06658.1 insulinase family protein [Clostridiaceae bacterium]
MKIIESLNIKEKAYIEKLENGMTVIIIPKNTTKKKYVIWGVNFGSIDNHFKVNGEEIYIPDGVAHFLEHKMFEQENGKNSLDTLMALGIDANAYTTSDHTAYLFECTDHFYEGLDELMNYVQNPYFTNENVEKEKGIIAQEIKMYDDDPGWQLYMGILDCLYKNNPIKVDIAGTVESISKITPEVLYKCYNTFYALDNMTLVICGDFEPEKLLEEVKKRLTKNKTYEKIERIYPEKEKTINKKYVEKNMNVSMPIFAIGIKDVSKMDSEIVKKHIAIEILLNMIIGKSSDLYKKMYNQGLLLEEPSIDYEFSEEYAHIVISGQSNDSEEVYKMFKEEIENYKNNELNIDHFERIKKKIYGDYVVEYNSVSEIARMFLTDHMKKISSFDYIEQYKVITKEYVEQVLKEIFNNEYMALAIVKEKD